jgi:uncharacterized membrane protein YciS (DUF1049 family)
MFQLKELLLIIVVLGLFIGLILFITFLILKMTRKDEKLMLLQRQIQLPEKLLEKAEKEK